jgi:GNAT superfamily N-acetyltransferase
MTEIRLMKHEDIEAGLELCRFAGWNQIRSHWDILLALAPDGVFAAEAEGRVRGTASAVNHGTRTGWIGMILVHPEFRGRGIATSLMSRCIEHLRGKGVESIKLDATDMGRPVYLKLGFKDERTICRYAGKRSLLPASCEGVRAIAPDDWPMIARMDREAFDADRTRLLKLLHNEGDSAVVVTGGKTRGYGFARRGFRASSIGPVVAADPHAARGLILHLLGKLPEGDVFWDFMPDNTPCRELAESLGFTVARNLTRMYLGAMNPGQMKMIYAGAGFELG